MMRKANITMPIIISFLFGLVGALLIILNGYRILAYKPLSPWKLDELSEQEIKSGRYVQGEIVDCFKISFSDSLGGIIYMGNDEQYILGAYTYYSYTIPIAQGQYIRVWMREWGETRKNMDALVNGQIKSVQFTGEIKKGSWPNPTFYDHDAEFDQSRIVADYSIWEKGTDSEINMCILGFLGLFLSLYIYRSAGGIEITEEIEVTEVHIRSYNQENELNIAIKILDRLYVEEKQYHKKMLIGIILICIGLYIDFGLNILELKMMGLFIVLYGMKMCLSAFINSSNPIAMWIARKFSLRTLQTRINEQERKKEELKKQIKDGSE